jgi:hypothetical protein
MDIVPSKYEYRAKSFKEAFNKALNYIEEQPEGTVLLMVAQLNR